MTFNFIFYHKSTLSLTFYPLTFTFYLKVAKHDVNLFLLLFKIIVKIELGICKKRVDAEIRTYRRVCRLNHILISDLHGIKRFIYIFNYEFLRSKYSPLVNTSDDNIILNPLICIILYSTNSRFAAV